jgi:predicted ATPase/DNA-binding SARP family transcriptional activator
MDFKVLGPLEVRRDGAALPLGGGKPRALLAVLLLHANEPVSAERLAGALWGEDAPPGAVGTVRVHVSRLRRALGDEAVLTTTPAGYRLRLGAGELDLQRFEQLVDEGRHALADGRLEEAGDVLRAALSLWRGPALADLAFEPFAQAEIARLEEQRLAALELRVEGDLNAGRHAELLPELQRLVSDHPLRERLHAQRMLALYRCGRQAEALEAYRQARRTLVEELGIEPGPELRRLEREVLEQAPSLQPPVWRARVPLPPNATLGRERELRAAAVLLRDPATRLLTLMGPGGVGKTRLALELAHALAPEFDDGAHFVALASVAHANEVPGTVAQALGVTVRASETSTASLARYLAPRQVLLVLDNFEHVHDAGALLGEMLAASASLRLLVTSRRPLRLSAERALAVPPLDPADAVALFGERARAAGEDVLADPAEAAAAASICARLDGLPLAIELAAARVRVLPPRALLRRFDRRFELLGPGARDGEDRQRTLRAVLDWSHDLLAEPEQALLRRLAVFAGGCTVDAAVTICTTDARLDGLTALVDHSLLRRDAMPDGEPRFSMLETVREYAAARLVASSEGETVRQRHAHYFAAYAEQLSPEVRDGRDAAALDLVEVELDNLRTALDWAQAAGRNDLELRIAGALWWFWFLRGYAREGLARLDAALSSSRYADPARANALIGRALLRAWLGEFAGAEADGNELLTLAENTNDTGLRARAIDRLALAAQQRGDWAQARALYEELAALSRRTSETRGLGIALNNLADIALNEDRYEQAAALCAEAVEIARAERNIERLATTLSNLGSALLALGRARDAARHLAESLRHSQQLGLAEHAAYALDGLGAAAVALGHLVSAARLLGAADATFQDVGTTLQAFETRRRADVVTQLQDQLGHDVFAAAWAEGKDMRPADAAALILEDSLELDADQASASFGPRP